jgi:adenylylsulfate kinase
MKDAEKGFALWFTGLPCSGKTTLAVLVSKKLRFLGYDVEHLDGDSFRLAYSKELGFSKKDREKNVSRAARFAARFVQKNVVVAAAFVSPYRNMREHARKLMGSRFIEIYLRCPLSVCEKRDVKGMYQLARLGKIKNFTGVSAPYETPLKPEIVLDTDSLGSEECVDRIMAYLDSKKFVGLKTVSTKKSWAA